MKTIGLVGGVASGKSLVGRMLVELGAGLLDADRAGHSVLAEDSDVRELVHNRWGDSILTPTGAIDRTAIAQRVFAQTAAGVADRQFLESVLHPRIRQRLNELRNQFADAEKPAVVLDAPLLLEAGWGPLCDVILFVEVPREKRLERAVSRGWTAAEFARREASQWPIEQKQSASHVVLTNTGTEADLRTKVQRFWEQHISPQHTSPTISH